MHELAKSQGKDHYIDPNSGFNVMTDTFLKTRGYCCENNCRHCPYGYKDLGLEKKKV